MNQRPVIILVVGLIAVGVLGAGINSIRENKLTAESTPQDIGEILQGQQAQKTKEDSNLPVNQDNDLENIFGATKSPPQIPSKLPTPLPQIKQYRQFPGELALQKLENKKAVISTDKGIIEFEIYPEATKAASNFIFLSQEGFYDHLTFHRVEPGFVVQGGDPNGNGTGGPGYLFEDEPIIRTYSKGIVAMANAGPNTNGSQFFILLTDHPELAPKYTIFGKVISNMDIVEQIKPGDIIRTIAIGELSTK